MQAYSRTGSGAQPDRLSMQEFNEELRRGLDSGVATAVVDPLTAAVTQIQAHPHQLQSLLLARILSALTFGVGHFRRAEVFGLDRATRVLVVALESASQLLTMPNAVWQSAVDAAGAAQLGTHDPEPPAREAAKVKA
jgi:hypothetical protein